MSGQIADSKINEIRERADIVELVSQYVSLKRSGANHSGLCPFHSEKTPSFSVNAARQFYHCFGCGVGGDVFSFLMKVEGLNFPEAVRRLADRYGIEIEEQKLSPEEERRQRQRDKLFDINRATADYFHRLLMEALAGEAGRHYLKQRGYGRNTAETFQLGFADKSWTALKAELLARGYKTEDIRQLGLIRPGKQGDDYDLFRGRLMIPIHDLNGRVVAFGGRVLDDSKPKYINSPESPIYHKSAVLFGLFQARQAMRQAGEVLVVEGYFDQLALFRAGFVNVVATCGTALTAEHAKLLKRYVQRVLLLFDQDAAGRQATFRAMAALQEEGLPSRVVELPAGDDPDSFLVNSSPEAFRQRLEQARPAMDVFMQDCLAGTEENVEARAAAAEEILAVVGSLPSELEQDLYLKKLAADSGIELELLKKLMVRQVRPVQSERAAPRPEPVADYYLPVEDDYPLPEDGYLHTEENYAPVAEPLSGPATVEKKAVQPLSTIESPLLSLMLLGLIKPVAYRSAAGLMRHPDAVAIADAWAGVDPEGEDRLAKILEALPPDLGRLAMNLAIDDGRYSENAQRIADDCIWALEKLSLQERIADLQKQKIPQAEQAGDTAQADIYCKELADLLIQLKGRR